MSKCKNPQDAVLTIINGVSCDELNAHIDELIERMAEWCRSNSPYADVDTRDFTADAEATIEYNTSALFEGLFFNSLDLGAVFDYAAFFCVRFLGDSSHHMVDLVAEYVAWKVLESRSADLVAA